MKTYILERVGWDQWLDDGGVWQGNREVAREYASRDAAEEAANRLNEEFAAHDGSAVQEDVVVIEVPGA